MNAPDETGIKVAAVFASYNRKEFALACVGRLMAQTRPVDLVVVADNDSGDGSRDALDQLDWDCLEVFNTGENLGNAGAVRDAMEVAFGRGADVVWILDDDSWPRVDALEHLMACFEPGWVNHPLQMDPKSGHLSWPLQVADGKAWRLVDCEGDLPGEAMFETRSSWTGALVSRRVREEVGPVNGDWFIRGEDEDYPWRIGMHGFRFRCIRGAVLDHPGPASLVCFRFGGRSLFLEPGLVDWKLYYKVRNMVCMKRRQSGRLIAVAMAIGYAWGIARVDGAHRLGLWWHAVVDGFRGRLGRWSRGPGV